VRGVSRATIAAVVVVVVIAGERTVLACREVSTRVRESTQQSADLQ